MNCQPESCGGVADPLVLTGEEAVQFCGYPIGFLAVVRGGVPGALQHYSSASGRTRLSPSSEAARLRALLEPPSSSTPVLAVNGLRVVRQGGDELARGHHTIGRGRSAVRLMAKSRAAPRGCRGSSGSRKSGLRWP